MKYWACTLVMFILIVTACKKEVNHSAEIANVELELQLSRFDREFARAEPTDLYNLKQSYPYLFPEQYPDSIWLQKMRDTIQIELLEEVDKAFDDFKTTASDIELLFKHIRYYFPATKIPQVITVSSDVDYNNRVILADTLMLLGLDNYLGEDHHFYKGIDRYIAEDLDKQYLISDMAGAFANRLVKIPQNRSFLSRMIYHGKILFLKDRWMPWTTDAQKMHYSTVEMEWARANEEEIWRYFIERELLYSTAPELERRFLDPAPFSKFRLELDSESPDRLGRYMGWMIVRAFEENNDIGLGALIALPEDELFKKSKYKPNR